MKVASTIKRPGYCTHRFLILSLSLIIYIPIVFASSKPGWYESRPSNSSQFMFGVGQGASRQLAIESALVEVASSIRIDIRSKTDQTRVYANGKEKNIFNEKTSSEIAKTQFSHYDVLKSEEIDGVNWVLVAVNRALMSKDIMSKINALKSEVELRFRQFAGHSSLEKSQSVPMLNEKLTQLKLLLATESALDRSFDPTPFTQYVVEQEEKLRQVKNKLVVKIEVGPELDDFGGLLTAYLVERDVKVVEQGARKGKSVIAVESKVKENQIQNLFVTKVEVKIDAINEQGAVLKSYVKTLNGVSPSSFQAALSQANQKLFNLILKDKVVESFGL